MVGVKFTPLTAGLDVGVGVIEKVGGKDILGFFSDKKPAWPNKNIKAVTPTENIKIFWKTFKTLFILLGFDPVSYSKKEKKKINF